MYYTLKSKRNNFKSKDVIVKGSQKLKSQEHTCFTRKTKPKVKSKLFLFKKVHISKTLYGKRRGLLKNTQNRQRIQEEE